MAGNRHQPKRALRSGSAAVASTLSAVCGASGYPVAVRINCGAFVLAAGVADARADVMQRLTAGVSCA
jgi:hypothetical protein